MYRSEVTFLQLYFHPGPGDSNVPISSNLANIVWCSSSGLPVEILARGNKGSMDEGLRRKSQQTL